MIVICTFLVPVGTALIQTHKFREPIGDPPSAAYERVTFPATDRLRLAGWYRASENRAAVILVHGGGGDRTGAQAHAQLLARHGYGVLLYDAGGRGRGESEGSPTGYGWDWEKDVAGALTFLRERAHLDPDRIGALGLSTGATVVIEAAAERKGLNAVVADGASTRSFDDRLPHHGLDIGAPFFWSTYTAARAFSGASPAPRSRSSSRASPRRRSCSSPEAASGVVDATRRGPRAGRRSLACGPRPPLSSRRDRSRERRAALGPASRGRGDHRTTSLAVIPACSWLPTGQNRS